MTTAEFFDQLDARIAPFDLLCHPFYRAWSAGQLSRDDLREYARDYYHHVNAFPTYLAELSMRLEEGELRRAVLANLADEKGWDAANPEHAELWLDFAEGMGASRNLRGHQPVPEIRNLMAFFHNVASEGTPEEALAAFYAYESQVPRVATRESARAARDVRRRRQNLRIFHPAQHRGCVPLADLAAATGPPAGTESAGGGGSPDRGRERGQGLVERVGRHRGAPDVKGRVTNLSHSWNFDV